MKKFIVTGKVQPERASVHISPQTIYSRENRNNSVIFSVDSSQLTAIVRWDDDIFNCIDANILAEDAASIFVSALGFALGSGYSVEIIQVVEEDNTASVFGVRPIDPDGESLLGFAEYNHIFYRAAELSKRDVFFRLALRDYCAAISDVINCASYCFRTIEGIKSAFVFKTGNESWNDMHTTLGTDRNTITTTIKNFADPIRHGNWIEFPQTTSTQRFAMLSLTKDILLRYLNLEEPQSI